MNILLISGHAGTPYDPGATATIDGTYYEEATLNIEVVDRMEKLLRDRYGANVSVYDRKRDAFKDSRAGTLHFDSGIDYILECHFNACVKDYAGDGRTTGTEIYWPSRGNATGAENAILERVCAVGFRNRGAMPKALAVINTAARAGIPANLIEVCFIDDADDMRVWLKNKDRICEAIAAGVAAHFGLKERPVKPPEDPWYIKDGSWTKATELKVVDGTRPGDPITRAEANVMMMRYLKLLKEGKV